MNLVDLVLAVTLFSVTEHNAPIHVASAVVSHTRMAESRALPQGIEGWFPWWRRSRHQTTGNHGNSLGHRQDGNHGHNGRGRGQDGNAPAPGPLPLILLGTGMMGMGAAAASQRRRRRAAGRALTGG